MRQCSVIIPVYNRAALTRQCLDRLLSSPAETSDVEIIVVNDGSGDSTEGLLASYGDRIRVVTLPLNSGFATACNSGAALASGTYLIFLNNDTFPLAGWLDALVRHAEAHPRAGAVGSKLLYPNGTIQHAGVVVCQDRYPRHIYLGFPGDHPAVNRSRRFQVVTGACMLVPRRLFQQVGGFDTAYVNCYEDVDLCLRLGELGHEIHYCHESVLYHLESVTEGRHRHEGQSQQVFRQRWNNRIRPDELQYYVDDGLVEIHNTGIYPLQIRISPLLGVVEDASSGRAADHLLVRRSQQVHELLRENILLHVKSGAGVLASAAASVGSGSI